MSLQPSPSSLPSTSKPASSWFWPLFIIALLVISSGGSILMVVIAVRDPSFAVEKDYYKKGVEWDLQRRMAKESEALGWKADLSLKAEMPNQPLHKLRLALLDPQEKPIDGASIEIQAFHNAEAAKRLTLTLKKAVDGRYDASFMANRPGLWIFRIEVQKEGKRFFQEQRQMLLLPKEKVAPTTHKGIKI